MIVIDNYTAARNDRFTGDSSFILDSYDLSGVGQASNGRWATLIGPNTVISANHFRPSGDITFFTTNSGTDSVTLTLGGLSQRIGNTDLWVSSLTSLAPSSLRQYAFDENGVVAPNLNAILTGRGQEAGAPNNRDQAFGTNVTTAFFEDANVDDLGTFDAIFLQDNDPGDLAYTFNEAFLAVGDSGAPLFVDTGNGELTLFGTNSATGSVNTVGGQTFTGSFINHTGQESAAINSFINAAFQSVPEPSSALLLSVGGLTLFSRRRRN